MSLNGLAIILVLVAQASQAIIHQWRHNILSTFICNPRESSAIVKEQAKILISSQNR